MIQLFDYVKLVFTADEKTWKELKTPDKARNFFMLTRFMAIKYPVQAGYLSHYRIDPSSASDYWHRSMSSLHKSTPSWIYAKTKKKAEEEKKLNLPSPEMIRWYCDKNEMSKRDFEENVKFFGESFLADIRSLEKIMKSQGAI